MCTWVAEAKDVRSSVFWYRLNPVVGTLCFGVEHASSVMCRLFRVIG